MTAAGLLDQLVSLLPARAPVKAASGVGTTMYGRAVPLEDAIRDPLQMMRQAQDVYVSNRHIRGAERLISQRFSTVPYHLEDAAGEEVTDESAPALVAIRDLIEKPYRPQPGDPRTATPRTRTDLWSLTSRHMGVCGMGYWYLDQATLLAGTPLQVLYINPARMTPAVDAQGRLTGWVLDANGRGGGTPLDMRAVVPFHLEPPDRGFLSPGLVASALTMVNLTRYGDRHAAGVLASGGRLAGVFSPKGEDAMPDEVYQQLVLDLRRAADDPDSARRMNVLKGPVEFSRTSATPDELDLVAVMNLSRDEVAELWGVPRSQKGGNVAVGLNSGEAKAYDEAVLWQNAVGPRLQAFRETVQYELLDRYADLGTRVELVIDQPEFDDETPQYERAAKAVTQPLTNRERRDILGMEPFGDDRDDEVWMAATMVRVWPEAEPAPMTTVTPPVGEAPEAEEVIEDEMAPIRAAKAASVDALRDAVAAVLARTGARVAGRVRERADHLRRKPSDVTAVLDADRLERELAEAMRPILLASIAALPAPGKADLRDAVVDRLLARVGLRIKGIVDTTRQRVADAIRQGLDEGLSAAELGVRIEGLSGAFDELRAETIARTESGTLLNEAAVEQYRDLGVTHVIVSDGDEDDPCAAADGQTWTLEEADAAPLAHPNCTRAFAPLVGAAAKARMEADMEQARWVEMVGAVKAVADRPIIVNVTVPEQAAPVVNVAAPVVNVPAPVVTVNIPEQPAPVVNVAAPAVTVARPDQDLRQFVVRRDPATGRVSRIVEEDR